MVRVAACQLDGDQGDVGSQWDRLVSRCRQWTADLVVLPEMVFSPWLAAHRSPDLEAWRDAAHAHERWTDRFEELGADVVVGSRPVVDGDRRFNEGFVWEAGGLRAAHRKTYLPDEPGFFEASWYDRGPTTFDPVVTAMGTVGFLICTELWFFEQARRYGQRGVDILVCPRATPTLSLERWLAAGQVAAICAGAFCVSSNRSGSAEGVSFAGTGWITDPDGRLIARTTDRSPVVSATLDLTAARAAKETYPRYVDCSPIPEADGP